MLRTVSSSLPSCGPWCDDSHLPTLHESPISLRELLDRLKLMVLVQHIARVAWTIRCAMHHSAVVRECTYSLPSENLEEAAVSLVPFVDGTAWCPLPFAEGYRNPSHLIQVHAVDFHCFRVGVAFGTVQRAKSKSINPTSRW